MFTKKHHDIVIQQSIAGNITEIITKKEEKRRDKKTIAGNVLNSLQLMEHIAIIVIYIQEDIMKAIKAIYGK